VPPPGAPRPGGIPGEAVRRRAEVWGVLNVTPDSFSDGGRFVEVDQAVARGLAMAEEGADVIDVGGESTRPAGATYGAGAAIVDAGEEARRAVPVVRALAGAGLRVSIDTTKAEVAEAALGAGAEIVNDVSGQPSEALLRVVAAAGAGLVLMHSRGRGEVAEPFTRYADVVEDVRRELAAAALRAEELGVRRDRLWLDPGLGFAKTSAQSGLLLRATPRLVSLGYPVLVGASRKGFVATLGQNRSGAPIPPDERLGGSVAAAALAVHLGAEAVRVHDVRATCHAVDLVRGLVHL